jgi:succinoglycan biosynthesis protein ExoV
MRSPKFHIVAVRGPLTAALAGVPQELAVTDPALLLRTIYPQLLNAPNRTTGKPIFVPHFTTAKDQGWRRACALAGIELVDPTRDCIAVLKRIASAPLVIAEAMHAAIVADAFRVPWIPVASTRHFSTFKWVDWALSLQVPFEPTVLPAVSVRHKCQRMWLSLFAEHCRIDDVSTGGGDAVGSSEAVAALLRETTRRLASREPAASLWLRMKAAAFHKRILDPLIARISDSSLRSLDARLEREMSRVLSELAATPGYLSTREISAARLQTLLDRVKGLRNRIATGVPRAKVSC